MWIKRSKSIIVERFQEIANALLKSSLSRGCQLIWKPNYWFYSSIHRIAGCFVRGHMEVEFIAYHCNTYLHVPLVLWVRFSFIARCNQYTRMWYIMSVTCDRRFFCFLFIDSGNSNTQLKPKTSCILLTNCTHSPHPDKI